MGVDAKLILPATLHPECIVYSFVKACGFQPDLVQGEQNVYSVDKFVHRSSSSFTFNTIEARPKSSKDVPFSGQFLAYLYFDNESGLGPAWVISSRSRADFIAQARTVAERFGGLLIYRDSDDKCQLFYGDFDASEDGMSFTAQHKLAAETPTAVITDADKQEAAYEWREED